MATFGSNDRFGFISNGTSCGGCGGCNQIIVEGVGLGSSVRCAASNTSSGAYASVFGKCNTNTSSNYGFIGGGCCNNTSNNFGTIIGGFKNSNQGQYSYIGNGICNQLCNSVSGCCALGSVIVGGVGNGTCGGTWNLATCSFTVAPTNFNVGRYSFIGNGFQNVSRDSEYVSVLNGFCNYSNAAYSTILNGCCNINISSEHSIIGGGCCNTQYFGNNSLLLNGCCNYNNNNNNSVIIGGSNNCLCLNGGGQNSILGSRNTYISAIAFNTLTNSVYSSISGTYNNSINTSSFSSIANPSAYSHVLGGCFSQITGCYSSLVGGGNNFITSNRSFISGGCCNLVSNVYSTISNGQSQIISGCNSFIGNGCCNINSNIFGFVGNGFCNIVSNCFGSIINGSCNLNSSLYGNIINGTKNNVCNAEFSTISNGYNNIIVTDCISGILGGCCNRINPTNVSCNSFIGYGFCNTISNSYDCSATIVNGICNCISSSSQVFIGTGFRNKIQFDDSVIVGGNENCITAQYGAILNGKNAKAYAIGQHTNSNGSFNNIGDNQSSKFILWDAIRTNASGTANLYLDGAGVELTIPNNTTWNVNVAWTIVVATLGVGTTTISVGSSHVGNDQFFAKNLAGTITISAQTNVSSHNDAGMPSSDINYSASGTNLRFTFTAPTTGGTATTYYVNAVVTVSEIGFAGNT